MTKVTSPVSYREAGVDEAREQAALRELMVPWFNKTQTPSSTASILGVASGHFATVVQLAAESFVALTTDGVGTKILVARMARRYDTVGSDCVANNVNDLICIGAKPLVFLDYIAIDRIDESVLEDIAKGLAEAAQEAGVEVAGGEIAQVRGLLGPPDNGPPMFDLVGMALGVLRQPKNGGPIKALDGSAVREGDAVLALPSSGLHSNGYSLARHVLFDLGGFSLADHLPGLERTLADVLLEPTRIYVRPIEALRDAGLSLNGLVNISGGGLLNLARLNASVSYALDSVPEEPPIFRLIRQVGGLGWPEMFATFNMGVGICIVLPQSDATRALRVLEEGGHQPFVLGRVVAGNERTITLPAFGLTSDGEVFREA